MSPYVLLYPLNTTALFMLFYRLTVPGALPMSDMLPYTDIAFDLHTHAVYLTKHSRAPSSYPSYRPKATAAASIDVSVQPCSSVPVPLLSVDETVSEFLESAKNILADSLESFFPTPHTKSTRIYHTTTLCPFWFAARTSIRALRHTPYTPYKSPLMDGPGHLSKNTMFKDIEDDDVNMDEEISKNIPQDVTSSSTWNILHLAVRTGRVDVFRYLLNLPQVPGPKSADDGYLGGVQQLLKGRKVTVNKASLCLCACYYNKPECLDILRSYQYFHAKIPADGIRRDSFLTLSKSPKKRLALPITRAPILHLSPETEFKLSSKLHFEPSNREYSLLDLSAYIGNEDCFCYLLQSTDSKYTEEDITAVWSTIVTCMRRGCLSEACLLLAVTWVLERVTKADLSVLDDANDSVHLDDFDTDDAAEENKKESVLSLACTLKAVIVPTPDMMRFPNRYRNRKGVGVVRVSSVLSTESGVITLNDEKEEEKVDSSAHLFQETVLHLSCRRGLLLIVRVLLQYGANPHVRDSTVRSPISLFKLLQLKYRIRSILSFSILIVLSSYLMTYVIILYPSKSIYYIQLHQVLKFLMIHV